MKILHVVGARPNFMKIAPLMHAMAGHPDEFEQFLVHTGQHYDANMSKIFFDELGMPVPDVNLGVGSGSHAVQTAAVMTAFEPILVEHRPDWVVVPGDVNSTLACTLVASKLAPSLGVRVAHLEAGLRSWDRTMPEEINRLLTDQIADLLLTPSKDGDANLLREGVAPEKIRFVGNIMIDTLVRLLPQARMRWEMVRSRMGLEEGRRFVLVTLHRPGNVDDEGALCSTLDALAAVASDPKLAVDVVFPVHPRTRCRIEALGSKADVGACRMVEPLGYLDFMALVANSSVVVTDSGGLQEETTYLGIPCLTLRPNTERPVTIQHGTNKLVRGIRDELLRALRVALAAEPGQREVPELWDGRTAGRIVDVFRELGA